MTTVLNTHCCYCTIKHNSCLAGLVQTASCLYNHCWVHCVPLLAISFHTVQYGCSDPSCVERLSPASNLSYFLCLNKSWNPDVDERYINKGCCHFLNVRDGERESVLLASFPGSGNTWIRGLLERITGLCTGTHISATRHKDLQGIKIQGHCKIQVVEGLHVQYTQKSL